MLKQNEIGVTEAAKLLNISGTLFRMYCRAGKFKSARKVRGTTWVLERKEVEDIAKGKIEVDFSGTWSALYGD